MGFLYRIILSRTLGQEGLGIYQIGLSVFAVLLTIVCSGIPVTVSRLMAKYRSENNVAAKHATVSAALLLSLALSLPLTALLFFGHKYLDFLFSDQRCMSILLIMIPSLVFSSVYSVIRGVFWGNKDFVPYCLVEMVEEISMIVIGIILVTKMTDVFDGAKRAAIALLLAYTLSFITAVIVFLLKKERLGKPKGYVKPLLISALPITGTRTLSSAVNSLIAIIMPLRLIASGLTTKEALSEFGMAYGMAIPILFIPATIIGSLAVVLVPELAENYYKKHRETLKRNIEKGLKFAALIACLMSPVLMVTGENIGLIVFNDVKSGIYISKAALIMLPMSLSMMSTSMLNSINCEKQSLLNFSLGAAIMLLCLWFTPKYLGSLSLAAGLFLSYTLTSALNLIVLNKKSSAKLNLTKFLIFSSLFMLPVYIIGKLAYSMLGFYLSTIFSTLICMIFMLSLSVLFYHIFDMLSFKELKTMFKKRQL